MGSFAYDDPCDRPYGPTNPDYEGDAKRAASGISPELLSLQDARIAGAKAGDMGNGASLNPYQHGTPEHVHWENARSARIGFRLNTKPAPETA